MHANFCSIGAVLIEGPRACGKKTAARRLATSGLDLSDDTACQRTSMLLDMAPELVLGDQAGDAPRLFAEWQRVPRLCDEIRIAVDDRGAFGQFILTGSSVPADTSEILHSGTGRFARLRMRPMSLFESGYSTGAVSLEVPFNGAVLPTDLRNPLSLDELAALICRGGWPEAQEFAGDEAFDYARAYVQRLVREDLRRVDGVKRNPERTMALLRALARRLWGPVSLAELGADTATGSTTGGEHAMGLYAVPVFDSSP